MKNIQKTLLLLLTTAGISPCTVNAQGSGLYAGTVPNCVARWTFDGPSTSFVVDSTSNNNNGILSNAVSAEGWRNIPAQAAIFNGSSTKATIPNSPSLQITGDMTIVALVKFKAFNTDYCQGNQIVMKGVGDRQPGAYILRTSDNKYDNSCNVATPDKNIIESSFGEESSTPIVVNQPYIDTGKWYFFASTFVNGDNRKLYQVEMDVNNFAPPTQAITTVNTASFDIGVNNYDVTLGYAWPTSPFWFNGLMDEIVIFDKCLTAKELIDVYTFLWNKGTNTTAIHHTNSPIAQDIQYYTQNQQLHLASTASNAYQVTLTDMLGRKIGEHTLKDRLTVDLSAYARQIFIINVYSEKGKYAFKITNE